MSHPLRAESRLSGPMWAAASVAFSWTSRRSSLTYSCWVSRSRRSPNGLLSPSPSLTPRFRYGDPRRCQLIRQRPDRRGQATAVAPARGLAAKAGRRLSKRLGHPSKLDEAHAELLCERTGEELDILSPVQLQTVQTRLGLMGLG